MNKVILNKNEVFSKDIATQGLLVCDRDFLYKILNSSWAMNYGICDLRDSKSFATGHIRDAQSMNFSKKLVMKKSLFEMKQIIQRSDNLKGLICYDDTGSLTHDVLQALKDLSKLKTIYILKGGYQEFSKHCDEDLIDQGSSLQSLKMCSPSNPDIESEDIFNQSISKIFDNLYIGNEADSQDLGLLTKLGITHILCVNSKSPLLFTDRIIYKKVEAKDCMEQNLTQYFPEAIEFIASALRNGGRILVHCTAGVSRSVTIVMAYIIHGNYTTACNIQFQCVLDILEFIRSKRPIASPNFSFLGQLERYNLELRRQKKI